MTDFHHESVDCATALERLESVWPEDLSDASLDAELTPAWEHVQACSTCWSALRLRRESDQQIADAMQSVPVRVGLQQRLLAQLPSAAATDGWHDQQNAVLRENSENPLESGPRQTLPEGQDMPHKASAVTLRRRAWMLAAAATLLIGIASGSWLWFAAHPSQVSIQTICEQAPLEAGDLPVASDPPTLPQSWLRLRGKGLRTVGSPRLFTPSNSKAIALWISFEVRVPKQPVIRGVLVAAPRGNIIDPPAELIVQATRLGYAHRDGHPVAVAGWSERGVVYVCFVRGEASLEWLLRQTEPTSA